MNASGYCLDETLSELKKTYDTNEFLRLQSEMLLKKFDLSDDKLKKHLEVLTKKAKKYTGGRPSPRTRSSLHTIIKIKQQANRFMKMLELA